MNQASSIENLKWENSPTNFSMNFEKLSDKDLYKYCKKVGFNALIWSRQFIAAIPEVAKRRLYKKYGYCSIHEFAAKLAGVSHNNVDEVLRVSEKFKELPKMKALIGEVGLSKLRVVACVANKTNEKEIEEKVRNMTKSSLEIYVREILKKNNNGNIPAAGNGRCNFLLPGEENVAIEAVKDTEGKGQIGLFDSTGKNESRVANPPSHYKKTFTIQIDDETEFELRKFKLQLEKEKKEPVDWNSALKETGNLNKQLNPCQLPTLDQSPKSRFVIQVMDLNKNHHMQQFPVISLQKSNMSFNKNSTDIARTKAAISQPNRSTIKRDLFLNIIMRTFYLCAKFIMILSIRIQQRNEIQVWIQFSIFTK